MTLAGVSVLVIILIAINKDLKSKETFRKIFDFAIA
jgi:hypothetical protein